jgi:hypothetical protein
MVLASLCVCLGLVAADADDQAAPLVLENPAIQLKFDRLSGRWVGLIDRADGTELVTDPSDARTELGPGPPALLDGDRLERAVEERRAIDLTGAWLYTPDAVKPDLGAKIASGDIDAVRWVQVPLPSREVGGDGKLRDRVGEFWYRRTFEVHASWDNDLDLAVIVGAIDDFDTIWVNGHRVGSTGISRPHFWETPRRYLVPASAVRRDGLNSVLIKVFNGSGLGGVSGPIAIGPARDLDVVRPRSSVLDGHELDPAARTLRLTAHDDRFDRVMTITLDREAPRITRHLTVRNRTDREQVFSTAAFLLPPLAMGADTAVIFPGTLPVGDVPVGSLAEGESLSPRSRDPLAVLWSESSRRGLGVWFDAEEEFAPVSAERAGAGASLGHRQEVVVRLQPGASVRLGTQHAWLARGTRDDALRGVQAVYRDIKLKAPDDGLENLRSMVVYCGHPGGPPELNYRSYGGFIKLEGYVPTLKRMNVDVLWSLPIWEHGDGKTYNLYSPFDHFKVSPLYGTPEQLKSLSNTCRDAGIRLLFDLVPHGPPAFTEVAKAHPEWVARKPDGSNQEMWNQLAFDNAHPGWQAYMKDAAAWGSREFGAVGARVDCGAGGPLNWNPEVTNRPSLSSLAAGLGMNRAIREGYRSVVPRVLVLPEEYTGANIFTRVSDLTYDAQLYFLMMGLQDRAASPEDWADQLTRFLHDQSQTAPPGALRMRWVSNHDTVSWTFQKKRPLTVYGVDRMRALLALCAWVEGVPMLYQGDEDPSIYGGEGPSSVAFLSQVYGLRKSVPALRDGTADYASARASGGVFACVRRVGADDAAVVLVSFNPGAIESQVSLPATLRGVKTWRDAMTGQTIASRGDERPLQVPMGPHQARVLVPSAK